MPALVRKVNHENNVEAHVRQVFLCATHDQDCDWRHHGRPNYEKNWSYLGVRFNLKCVGHNHCRLPRFMQSNLCSELIIMAPKSVTFVSNTYS